MQTQGTWGFCLFMLKTFPFGLKNGVAFGFKSLLFKTVLVEPDIMLEFESLLNEWDEDEKGTAFGFKLLPFWIILGILGGGKLGWGKLNLEILGGGKLNFLEGNPVDDE